MKKLKLKYLLIGIFCIVIFVIVWNFTAYRDIKYIKSHASYHIRERRFREVKCNYYRGNPITGGAVFFHGSIYEGIYQIKVVEWKGNIEIRKIKRID